MPKSVQLKLPNAPGVNFNGTVLDRFAQAPDDAKVGDPIEVEGKPFRIIEVHPGHVVASPEL